MEVLFRLLLVSQMVMVSFASMTVVEAQEPTPQQIVKKIGDTFWVNFGAYAVPDVPVSKVSISTSYDSNYIGFKELIDKKVNGGTIAYSQPVGPSGQMGLNITYTAPAATPLVVTDVLATIAFTCKKSTGAAGVGLIANVSTYDTTNTLVESAVYNLDTVRIMPRKVNWLLRFLDSIGL